MLNKKTMFSFAPLFTFLRPSEQRSAQTHQTNTQQHTEHQRQKSPLKIKKYSRANVFPFFLNQDKERKKKTCDNTNKTSSTPKRGRNNADGKQDKRRPQKRSEKMQKTKKRKKEEKNQKHTRDKTKPCLAKNKPNFILTTRIQKNQNNNKISKRMKNNAHTNKNLKKEKGEREKRARQPWGGVRKKKLGTVYEWLNVVCEKEKEEAVSCAHKRRKEKLREKLLIPLSPTKTHPFGFALTHACQFLFLVLIFVRVPSISGCTYQIRLSIHTD